MIPGLRKEDCQTPLTRWLRRIVIFILVLLALNFVSTAALRYTAEKYGGKEPFITSAQLRLLSFNLDTYKQLHGRYPSQEEGLKFLSETKSKLLSIEKRETLTLDAWGQPLIYRYPSPKESESYTLFSVGPDGVEDTADDITSEAPPSHTPAQPPALE